MVHVSLVAKRAMVKFLFWNQKNVKKLNALRAHARSIGGTYLGKTPLSEMVVWKVMDVAFDLSELLTDGALADPKRWGAVWKWCPDVNKIQCTTLIVDASLRGICGWHHRDVVVTCWFPYLLLLLCEKSRWRCVRETPIGG